VDNPRTWLDDAATADGAINHYNQHFDGDNHDDSGLDSLDVVPVL